MTLVPNPEPIPAAHWRTALLRLVTPAPRRLPRAAQIVLQHLRRQAQQEGAARHALRSSASLQSFLRDLLDSEENANRQPGE